MTRLIDADEMVKSLMDMTFYDEEGYTIHDYEDRLAIVKSFVDSVPTVEAQPVRHGHWIGVDDEPYEVFECDMCGYIYETDRRLHNYCPHCGAKMGEDDGTD